MSIVFIVPIVFIVLFSLPLFSLLFHDWSIVVSSIPWVSPSGWHRRSLTIVLHAIKITLGRCVKNVVKIGFLAQGLKRLVSFIKTSME